MSGDDSSILENKTALNKLLINELWPPKDYDMAWCATLPEFCSESAAPKSLVDGLTPVFHNIQDAAETYQMLVDMEFSRLAKKREESLAQALASGLGPATPVVALSYKHLRCSAKSMQHMTISRNQFLDSYYRIYQLFEQSRCICFSTKAQEIQPVGVVLWFDRMLLVANIGTQSAAWVERGLAPYMATMSYIDCISKAEYDFEHYDKEVLQIDALYGSSENARIGDVLASFWMAIEFDLAYGTTSVVSSTASMAWTPVMYHLPDIDTINQKLQSQVRNLLARNCRSLFVSGIRFNERMLTATDNNTKGFGLYENDQQRPVIALGNPRTALDKLSWPLHKDLCLYASLLPLIGGEHKFSRVPYAEDVLEIQTKWTNCFERIVLALSEISDRKFRQDLLLDLFAPREFDIRIKGLDHLQSYNERNILEYIGHLHLLQQSVQWKPLFAKHLTELLVNCKRSPAYTGRIHCNCFRHSLSPTRRTKQLCMVEIEVFQSAIFPLRAVYAVKFSTFNQQLQARLTTASVSGRCPKLLLQNFQQLQAAPHNEEHVETSRLFFSRELARLLVTHGKVIKFFLNYGLNESSLELCDNESNWTYLHTLKGSLNFRTSVELLLDHALNKSVLHTRKCEEAQLTFLKC